MSQESPQTDNICNSLIQCVQRQTSKNLKNVCYCLTLDRRATYIGATNNLTRRIRQHNSEIKGGARYTTSRLNMRDEVSFRKNNSGTKWEPLLYVEGFPDYRTTLQFEWRWKKMTERTGKPPIQRRLTALAKLFDLERVTRRAQKTKDLDLKVVWSSGSEYSDIFFYHTLRKIKLKLRPKNIHRNGPEAIADLSLNSI